MFISCSGSFVIESVLAQCLDLSQWLDLGYLVSLLYFVYLLPAFPTCLWNAFSFYSHIGLVFVGRVFYVGKIGATILEQVYCICPMRFCRFFSALFPYKWHAWACISYNVIKRHLGTGWVIWDFAGLALHCWWFKLCLEIATQYFVWWRRDPVRHHCCCGLWF